MLSDEPGAVGLRISARRPLRGNFSLAGLSPASVVVTPEKAGIQYPRSLVIAYRRRYWVARSSRAMTSKGHAHA